MRSILYYIVSKIKKLQSKDTEIDTEISEIKPRLTTAEENIETIQNNMMTKKVETVTDLNTDYTITGQYFFNNANAPTNRPSSSTAGYLEVFVRTPNDMLQRWINYDDNCTTFQRQKRSGVWRNWNSL